MDAHRRSGADATIALYRSREPLRYGLAVTDHDGLVRSFIEKPDWRRVVTDLVNTGIYVLSPRVMELVPDSAEYDFGKQLFPRLLESGRTVLGVPMDGYWCDVGTPLSYYRCCVDALEGRLVSIARSSSVRAARAEAEDAPEDADYLEECPCESRAELMGALCGSMLDMGADYSDGLRLRTERYSLHIRPCAGRSAVRIGVRADDAEFAKELALSAKALAQALKL